MGRTGTVSVLFTDIVGSTELLGRLGERDYDDVRRRHFTALRKALADHDGTEVKNTGDGLMAVFRSAVDAVDCAVAMQREALNVMSEGRPVAMRVGLSAGEATEEQGDWFGAPVVEAARLCAAAGTDEAWASRIVAVLAGSQAEARMVEVGPQTLKGFDQPVDVVRVEAAEFGRGTMYAHVAAHAGDLGQRLVAQLDYWETVPGIQQMRAEVLARVAPLPGDVVADIGCGAGTELIRLAQLVGPEGTVIGVDPSEMMLDEAGRRATEQGVTVELVPRDGRDTGLADGRCDAVRCERVVQHIGDVGALVDEARRITRPGGTVVLADTDWGSLMIHPGDPELVRRIKGRMEGGPMAQPWAGRLLPKALHDGGLLDVSYRLLAIDAQPGVMLAVSPVLGRMVEGRVAEQAELDALHAELTEAYAAGVGVWAFTMVVASGRVPG
jgi:class 3 adenylate cyclase/2-polyprenyl-3-methyl-5-hydroxy-6-metoxy-1,4-benzoquinol methylase